jgi:hypothetical protein
MTNKKTLFFFLSILFLNCSEEKPKVKIFNESEKRIDVYFSIKVCSCPSFSFQNIMPLSETEYRSSAASEYLVSLKDSILTLDTLLNTEMDKKYDIHYKGKNCSIIVSDQ